MKSDQSSLLMVGRIRYLQNAIESGIYKNPDDLVQHFLDADVRAETDLFARDRGLSMLAGHAFYNFVLLRTRYYDDLLVRAIQGGVKQVVIVGAGTDTRAYRFQELLIAKGVQVIECDQGQAIAEKERDARKLGPCAHVRFSTLDLGTTALETWAHAAGYDASAKTLFMVEGVSAYVRDAAFIEWLEFVAARSVQGSCLACDCKIAGVDDDFGRQGDQQSTVRMPDDDAGIRAYHDRFGLDVLRIARIRELEQLYWTGARERRPVFEQDLFVECSVR